MLGFAPISAAPISSLSFGSGAGGGEYVVFPDTNYTAWPSAEMVSWPSLSYVAWPSISSDFDQFPKVNPVPPVPPPPDVIQASQNFWFFDNQRFVSAGSYPDQYVQHDSFSRIVFTTSATTIDVEYVSQTASAADRAIAVWVNGSLYSTVTGSASLLTKQVATVPLPAGAKTVELEECTTRPGISITGLRGTFSIVSAAAPTRRLIIYGDSISVGYNASPRSAGYADLIRHGVVSSRFTGVTMGGFAGNTTKGFSDTAGKRTTLANDIQARADGTVENVLVYANATNDYGLPSCSAADFETFYGLQMDAFHALMPSLSIKCMAPFLRDTEVANSFGNTLGDYRTAIQNVVAARGSYCTYIAANTFINNTTDLSDGLHPTTAAHATIATALVALI